MGDVVEHPRGKKILHHIKREREDIQLQLNHLSHMCIIPYL